MAFINTLILIISITGLSRFIVRNRLANYMQLPLLLASFGILVVYIFGVLGYLKLGYCAFLATGVVLLAAEAIKNRVTFFNDITLKNALPFVICLVPFIVVFFVTSSTFEFTGWDEFSFWATSIKFIYSHDQLYTRDSDIIFKTYPPTQQLFQYIILKTVGWRDDIVLLSQSFFVISCLMFTAGSLIRNKVAASIIFVALITVLYSFYFDFSHIYVDPLLAVYAAAAISACYSFKHKNDVVAIVILLATLTLVKQVGLILGLYSVAVLAISVIFTKSEIKPSLKLYSLIAAFLAIVVSYISWSSYTASIGASVSITIPTIYEVLSNPFLDRLSYTLLRFYESMDNDYYYISSIDTFRASGPRILIVLFMFFMVAALLSPRGEKIKALLTGVALTLGIIAFNLFLIFCYLFIFTEFEGRELASYYRYSYAATIPLVMFALSYSVCLSEAFGRKAAISFAVILSAVLFYLAPAKFYSELRGIETEKKGIDIRNNVRLLADKIKHDARGGDASSYFISQGSTGFEKYVFNYEMSPDKSNWWCWSLGEKTNQWTCDKPLEDVIKGYKYLAIYYADPGFWLAARSRLAPGSQEVDNGVYRIINTGEKIELQLVK